MTFPAAKITNPEILQQTDQSNCHNFFPSSSIAAGQAGVSTSSNRSSVVSQQHSNSTELETGLGVKTRIKNYRKDRNDELPFEFKAQSTSDVMDNPDWSTLVSQTKNKGRKSKRSSINGAHCPPEIIEQSSSSRRYGYDGVECEGVDCP